MHIRNGHIQKTQPSHSQKTNKQKQQQQNNNNKKQKQKKQRANMSMVYKMINFFFSK
jgi:hypothetical protein